MPGRKCSVCSHTQIDKINQQLVANRSYRGIAGQFGLTDSSVHRHASTCVAEMLDAAREAQVLHSAVVTQDAVIEIYTELHKLVILARERLTDPDEPHKYTLAPRADDLMIVWKDGKDLDSNKTPRLKKAPLQELLDRLAKTNRFELVSADLPKVSPIKLLLEASREMGPFLDKLAKLQGEYREKEKNPKDRQWVEDLILKAMNSLKYTREEAIAWYQDKFPNVREFKGIH
jgi:hypothetical protein